MLLPKITVNETAAR